MTVLLSLLRIAFQAVMANKLRSGLTFIGIVFGVTSVMTIISAIEGVSGSIEDSINDLGPSTFIVSRMMVVMSREEWLEKSKRKPITARHAELLESSCELCEKISPTADTEAEVKYERHKLRDVGIVGVASTHIDIVDIQVGQGRFHSAEDDLYRRSVVFIGDDLRETFFAGLDPIGKEIKIAGKRYTVIGVAKKRGSMFGESQDNFAIIPFSKFTQQFSEPRRGIQLVIKAPDVASLEPAMDQARMILRASRKVPYNEPDDFDMMTADGFLDLFNQFTVWLRGSLVAISAISLVIGGIVVMNIMMVSVTERTREIGIRKSMGATRKHILLQFLFEAVLLTVTGGLIGILLGTILADLLVSLIDIQMNPSLYAILAGVTISTGIGVIFGVYPAAKAAALDPVKALSYE